MGKKSDKGRARKQKRLEEKAKVEASLALVNAANQLEDPMASLPVFKKFDRNGLQVSIECKKVADVKEDELQWAFQLLKSNMQTLYEESEWGWKDSEKLEEMTEDKAWYLIARLNDKPAAFVHFRFDLEQEEEVVYCYEIQLEKDVRRKGLGKFMMQILELLAHRTQMKKVMLTCFRHNPLAQSFFKTTLKYELDEISPEDSLFDDGLTYEILSKTIAPRKQQQQQKPAHTNGTADVKA